MDKNIKILVVDDFPTMRRIIKDLLAEIGYLNVAEADDGFSALATLKSGNFDLLVTDWNMPGLGGFGLLNAIRADHNLMDIPALMITVEALQDQITQATEAGISDYIVKPFTANTLRRKIAKVFSQVEVA